MDSFSNSEIQDHTVLITSVTNSQFMLKCPGKGSPDPSYQWFRNNEPVNSTEGQFEIGGHRGNLLTFNPNFDQLGYYHCTASNQFGVAKSEVILFANELATKQDFEVSPKFTTKPEVGFVEASKESVFKCVAEGEPKPDIIWTKNAEVLSEFNNLNELVIESVDVSNIGTYACNASNSVGYAYKVFYLNILNQPPYFTEFPVNRTVSIGQEVILRCSAKGHPKPEITWDYKSTANDSYILTDASDLKISKVKESDNGTFTCIATNSQGSVTYDGFLTVVSTTTIVNGPSDVRQELGKAVKMPCEVVWDTTYKLSVVWMKDNEDVVPDGNRVVLDPSDHSLLIKDLTFEDSGKLVQLLKVKIFCFKND